MGRGLDNYFLILELDFIKPESDINMIKQRIKDKSKFWNANSDKGKMQQKYRQYKSQVMEIAKVMDTESLRNAEARDAALFVQGVLKEELRYFSEKKEIEESAANDIMKRAGLWPEMFTTLSGLKIVTSSSDAGDKVEDPNPKPDKSVKFKQYDTALAVLHKKNLYDFLKDNDDTEIIGLQTLDGEELIKDYSDPLKERVKYERTEEADATRTMCAACEEVFNPAHKELRSNYDKFLIWQQKDDIISRMVKYAGSARKLTSDQKRLFTDNMTQIVRDRETAVKTIEQICRFKEISAGAPIAPEPGKVACGHCFTMVDTSHGERKCSNCGSDLFIKCPKCKKEVLASLAACGHCGFRLKDVQKVEFLTKTAQAAIANMEFDKARSNLAKAERLLSGFDKITTLKAELAKQESIFSAELSQLESLVSEKRFYTACGILHDLQKKVPAARIDRAVSIEKAVHEAEKLYKKAVGETSEDKLIELCTQLTRVCPDYPGVEALLIRYRPKPVSNIRITCNTSNCSNVIVWEKSSSAGEISYTILRKENTAAAAIDDTGAEEIGNAGIGRFVDTKPLPGITYYYSIYAMRAGVASVPAFESAVNLAEISITKKEEGDGYVRMEWRPLGRNAGVEVYRCEDRCPERPGDGVKIEAAGNYFQDDTVENDKRYGYLLTAVYKLDEKEYTTSGVKEMLIASSAPEPVEDLKISFVEADVFEAVWTYSGKEKIALYCTDSRCSLKYGDIVDINKVTTLLKPVEGISNVPGCCRFRIRDNKKYLIIPVTVKYNTAVIGEQALAAKIEQIKVEKAELINSDLLISLKWPGDAVSVLVIYGEDGYAKNLEDRKGKSVRSIPKKQFLEDTGLYIKNIERKDYYITLYSANKLNGELVYSDGTQLLFLNKPKTDIQYSVRLKGFINKQAEVEFTSEAKAFMLPDVDIIAKQGGVPVYVTSGMVVEHIDEQHVTGSYKLTIPVSSLPQDSHIKAFFTDDHDYDRFNLRPAYGTNFKVN